MNIKTRPFSVPNYVIEEADVPRSFRLSDFDAEELSAKCDEFRAAVFKKAGKDDPRWATPIIPKADEGRVMAVSGEPKCTTCDDTGIAVYPLRLCGDCDAGKSKTDGANHE